MSRISGVASLSSSQLRLITQLSRIGQAINQSTERLATFKRINSSKDDPAGMVAASLLKSQLAAADGVSSGLSRASGILQTADGAVSNVLTQLQTARGLILEAAGGGLSTSELAANQLELDSIIQGIDSLSRTTYGDRRLLDGSSGFKTQGVDTSKITDVNILSKRSAEDYEVSINVTSAATRASNTYTGGTLTGDATVSIGGSEGTAVVSLSTGDTTTQIAEAFNAVSYLTGVTASVSGGNVLFASANYGTNATIEIEATEGTFNTTGGSSVTGTNATATINGQTVTGDGATFTVTETEASFVVTVSPTVTGAISSFDLTGEGLNFVLGTDPANSARIGLPSLSSAHLGGSAGALYSLASGGSHTLTGGEADTALQIVDQAIEKVTLAAGQLGGFQLNAIEMAQSALEDLQTNTQEGLSAIEDTDIAVETARLTNTQLLQESALQSLGIMNQQQQGVLRLLQLISGM